MEPTHRTLYEISAHMAERLGFDHADVSDAVRKFRWTFGRYEECTGQAYAALERRVYEEITGESYRCER